MSYVLAIEPDEEQAALLRDAVRFRAKTQLKTVASITAATAAIAIPQLVLITSLMPPRQERTFLARVRGLPKGASPEGLFPDWSFRETAC